MNQDLARKIDRLDSIEQIKGIVARYALAVDSKDIDTLVDLFVEDVHVTGEKHGRDAFREHWRQLLARFRVSVLMTGTPIIDFDDDAHARGVVYCRDEREMGGQLYVGVLHYHDRYERRNGRWLFVSRKPQRLYVEEPRPSPMYVPLPAVRSYERADLPGIYPTIKQFWDQVNSRK